MNVPNDLLYTDSHEWVRPEDDKIRVGITDHAQAELTDVVYVELPKVGASYSARGTIAVVESVKAASDIYAPVKGTVLEVNKALESNPALVNTDPYGEGWIYVLQVENADELKNLKDAAAYKAALG
ncbi:MAG TPA: glycine cleavage system protein GcvH [Chthoniobacterales bacterium]|jgi:glycine cleavage system H protein